jgi:hypothetical protein
MMYEPSRSTTLLIKQETGWLRLNLPDKPAMQALHRSFSARGDGNVNFSALQW